MSTDPSMVLAVAPAGQQPAMWPSLVMMGLIFGIFYLLVFAPMRKKQKKHGEMLANLKSGDRVVTSGGILATVKAVGEHTVQLRIADQVTIELTRQAVAGMQEEKD